MTKPNFFSRDLSWLTFNGRVLSEATRSTVPLAERLKFLAIYSSNLDEFYRVRMPVLIAKQHLSAGDSQTILQPVSAASEFMAARAIINEQLQQFGKTLTGQLIPGLSEKKIFVLYNQPIPETIIPAIADYFFTTIAAFIEIVYLSPETDFFPENNKLYLQVILQVQNKEQLAIINIPSNQMSRFFSVQQDGKQYILFIDDIIRHHLSFIFQDKKINGYYSFKINRDAELNLENELPDNLAEEIESHVAVRDLGSATRLLHQPGIPLRHIQLLCNQFKITLNNAIEGGVYHNLKDIAELPLSDKALSYPKQTPLSAEMMQDQKTLLASISQQDILLHPPYNSYDTVLRFFNEAAIQEDVTEISVTLYRIASNSRIAHALISAAKSGKKVQVFVELKARFDEENNIRWAKRMKDAGVKVIYSIPKLKVHAKIALVKKKTENSTQYFGLLATGNMNESTARFYTDHVLLTTHTPMLQEMESLFSFLAKRHKPDTNDVIPFQHLLVAQFNLQQRFLELIDREIHNAQQGKETGICIKLNNLEERVLINKLYEASNAGVNVQLIVRSICCLIPGVPGMSENITIKRIVGRHLEHGRVFVFKNEGNPEVFMGSADWMNRNIYTRIEVCFPVYDTVIKNEILQIIHLQLSDNVQAVWIDEQLANVPVKKEQDEMAIDSQAAIYNLLKTKNEIYV